MVVNGALYGWRDPTEAAHPHRDIGEMATTLRVNLPTSQIRTCGAQLGLKLNATKAPVDVLVIDKVSKPSEN
jgi:uncharacterized protein (TIGR03435 family)